MTSLFSEEDEDEQQDESKSQFGRMAAKVPNRHAATKRQIERSIAFSFV